MACRRKTDSSGFTLQRTMKNWLTERYHAPADDLNQPVDKEAAVQFTRMLLDLCVEIAVAPEWPQWKPDSFFVRFASAVVAEAEK